MKQITIRGVSSELARALQNEKKRRGTSLNQAVLDLLGQSLGLTSKQYENGLAKFAGTWSGQEFTDFEQHMEIFEQVDSEVWK
jgi:hypothetical protein